MQETLKPQTVQELEDRIRELENALRPFAVDKVEGMAGYTNIPAARCKVMATFGAVYEARRVLGLNSGF